jgi:hypothetical protein
MNEEFFKVQMKMLEGNEQVKAMQDYGSMMMKMSSQVSELMMKEWLIRAKENKPVKSSRELYEIWLNCCHQVYGEAMHEAAWQNTYGESVNALLHYWKNVIRR